MLSILFPVMVKAIFPCIHIRQIAVSTSLYIVLLITLFIVYLNSLTIVCNYVVINDSFISEQ
jgi:hypothetical protein